MFGGGYFGQLYFGDLPVTFTPVPFPPELPVESEGWGATPSTRTIRREQQRFIRKRWREVLLISDDWRREIASSHTAALAALSSSTLDATARYAYGAEVALAGRVTTTRAGRDEVAIRMRSGLTGTDPIADEDDELLELGLL